MSATAPNQIADHTGTEEQTMLRQALGEAWTAMIERLDAIHARTHPGPWKMYQDGVHPCDVGGMASGDDYAICGQCYGPRATDHALWITSSHNEWPIVREMLFHLACRLLASEVDSHG